MSSDTTSQYLAIDLGATSGRAVLGSMRDGELQMQQVHRFPTPLVEEYGHLYWDLDKLEREVKASLSVALGIAPLLRSVSIDSWAVDYVPLGANGKPLRRPYAYRDPRSKDRLAHVLEKMPADTLYARTGTQFLELNTLSQVVADLAEEPDLVSRTKQRLLIADYFLYRLTGARFVEPTMASTTQLFDVSSGRWAHDVIETIGDSVARWPNIVAPGTRLGPVHRSMLPPNHVHAPIAIATCSHDTAAAIAAIPADDKTTWAYISSGTWSLVGMELSAPLLTPAARQAGFTNEIGLDNTVRFLKNRTGMWALEECIREWTAAGDNTKIDEWVAAAEKAPSAGTVVDINTPPFRERGDMEAKVRAACSACSMAPPESRAGLIRLIFESLADSYRLAIAELEALTHQSISVVHVVGGGARNTFLNQLTANACQRPVIAGPEEATTLGNLLVQMRTLGDLGANTVRDVSRRSTNTTRFSPVGGRT